jgi:flagellar biosynthetic protein FliQ
VDLGAATTILQQTVWLTLVIAAPMLAAALGVGLLVSILQAATQVNEQTLSFVPKIVASLVVFAWSFPYWMGSLVAFSREVFLKLAELP